MERKFSLPRNRSPLERKLQNRQVLELPCCLRAACCAWNHGRKFQAHPCRTRGESFAFQTIKFPHASNMALCLAERSDAALYSIRKLVGSGRSGAGCLAGTSNNCAPCTITLFRQKTRCSSFDRAARRTSKVVWNMLYGNINFVRACEQPRVFFWCSCNHPQRGILQPCWSDRSRCARRISSRSVRWSNERGRPRRQARSTGSWGRDDRCPVRYSPTRCFLVPRMRKSATNGFKKNSFQTMEERIIGGQRRRSSPKAI
jgi:hypothetical protein